MTRAETSRYHGGMVDTITAGEVVAEWRRVTAEYGVDFVRPMARRLGLTSEATRALLREALRSDTPPERVYPIDRRGSTVRVRAARAPGIAALIEREAAQGRPIGEADAVDMAIAAGLEALGVTTP